MGAPTKSQIESWSDRIAAMIQLEINGHKSKYTPATTTTLWDLVDASGDSAVETALMTNALAVDAMDLPARNDLWMANILQQSAFRAFATDINTLVTGSSGGSYASFRAYLVDKGAIVHPLYAELHRSIFGASAFTSSSVVAGVSNPTYSVVTPLHVFTGADGSLADDTTDAGDADTADVALFANDDESVYLGSDHPFQGACFALSTAASATITPTFSYWNGTSWATLTVTDNTSGMTQSDLITWTAPSDWARGYKDAGGTAFTGDSARLYYIKITRTANSLVTPPVATCITLVPTVIPTFVGGTTHAALQQPPLAIARITAASTISVTVYADIDGTRWAYPVGTDGKLRLRALTAISANTTVTLAYEDASGANGSTAQSAWSSIDALDTFTLALTSSDALSAVRTATTASTSATTGVFAIECVPIRTPAL